jgi:RNA polymerase sigma-70 factor (ECF subfamily)
MQDPGVLQGCVQARGESRLGIERDEEASQVREGLSQLRRLDRETLVAFYFEGQSLKQMSARFESPVGTIKRRLHTARHRLREALADFQPA